jgi:hypothetical protein
LRAALLAGLPPRRGNGGEMDQSNAGSGPGQPGYGAWLAFWGELVVLALLAVIGAFFAGADNAPGDYACGLILILSATAMAFLRLKNRFDGGETNWAQFLLVDDAGNLVVAIAVFTLVGLAGLFLAAAFSHGGMHNAGLALFVASGIAVFLTLKRVFDNFDRTR